MPAYFANEDRAFTPKGYLSVYQAVIRCALKWYDLDLSRFVQMSNEDLDIHNVAEHNSHSTEERDLIRTWNRLRQSLYDGTIEAKVISDETGQIIDVPLHVWGSSKVNDILYGGRIGISWQDTEFDGRACLSETDIKCLLDGITKPQRGSAPKQGLVILAPSNPETTSAYLPLGYIGIKEAHKAFHDKIKANASQPSSPSDSLEHRHELHDRAGRELCAALAGGALPSFHIQFSGGTVRPLKKTDWLPDGSILKSVTSSVVYRYPGGWYDRAVISTENGNVLGTIVVTAEDLLRVLRGDASCGKINEHAAISPAVVQIPDRGGRPALYNGELFLIEAAKVILDGVPETQAQLVERTLDAYEAAGHPGGRPGPDWAKAKIRPLWRRLELGDKR